MEEGSVSSRPESGIRHRLQPQSDEAVSSSTPEMSLSERFVRFVSSSPMASKLSKFDMYRKVKDTDIYSDRTETGGIISMVAICIMLFLFLVEFIAFIRVDTLDELSVDTNFGGKLLIKFNISFPHVPCPALTVDVVDIAGEQMIDLHQDMRKTPLAYDGSPAGESERTRTTSAAERAAQVQRAKNDAAKSDPRSDPTSDQYCGSCYGAEDEPSQCCNTCDAVKVLYKKRDWGLPTLSSFAQCERELLETTAGCNMHGQLRVGKVAGNFHFAPGRSFEHWAGGRVHHIQEFDPISMGSFDPTHTIHSISFGDTSVSDLVPHVHGSPLDGVYKYAYFGSSLFKYFLKVVPVTHLSLSGLETHTYQYAVTEHRHDYEVTRGPYLPGVFFMFELSPIQIRYEQTRIPFTHFLVRICAILGGVFTIAMWIDRVIERLFPSVKDLMNSKRTTQHLPGGQSNITRSVLSSSSPPPSGAGSAHILGKSD